jgi:hypothetical protein
MLHLVGYFVEEVFVYSTQQDIMFTRGADGRKCAGTNEPQGSRPLRIGNKATVSIETVASCCGIALPLQEKKIMSHTFGTSLGGTTWPSRSMEAQCRFLLENRIDDSPRMTLLKLPILGLILSTSKVHLLNNEMLAPTIVVRTRTSRPADIDKRFWGLDYLLSE